LNTHHPIGIAGPFDGFNDSVWRAGGNAKSLARLFDRLVVRAVDARFARTSELRKLRSGLKLRGMKRFRRALFTVPFVLDRRADGARDVLDEGAAQKYIQALGAKADGQNRLVFGEGVLQEREISPLAVYVRISAFRLPGSAKTRWIDICGAPGQNHAVQGSGKLAQLTRREQK
jgi:hypothetical protein